MRRLALLLPLAALLAPPASAAPRALPTLYVAYTMNCTFTITDDTHRAVTSIAPGSYQVQITSPAAFGAIDLSGTNDMTACKGYVQFHLTGPGVNISTTLDDGDGGYALYPATFQPGQNYLAVDNNQPSVARVAFSTLASGTPAAAASPSGSGSTKQQATGGAGNSAFGTPIPTALRGTLTAAVGASGALTLTAKGKPVSSLHAGRYKVVVADRSTRSGFALQQLKQNADEITGVGFVGTKTVTLTLRSGQWMFFPSGAAGKKTYFFVTA